MTSLIARESPEAKSAESCLGLERHRSDLPGRLAEPGRIGESAQVNARDTEEQEAPGGRVPERRL